METTKTNRNETDERASGEAEAQMASILRMVGALEAAQEADDETAREEAETEIQEDALSVQVRSGWYSPGSEGDDTKPEEFEILLCTGGPACRIVGELDEHMQPDHARIEYSDWGTPWTQHIVTGSDYDALQTYCAQFYFGE